MNLLVLDTSTDRAAIGVATGTGGCYEAAGEPGRRHGRDLIVRIRSLLLDAGLRARDLDAVAVGLGPGSYTGLRVGVMAAKSLAYATGAVLVSLDSLEAVARGAPNGATRISVIADAQRGTVYVADFVRSAPEAPLMKTGDCRIEPLAVWLGHLEPGVFVLGPGLDVPRIRSQVPPDVIPSEEASNYPQARRLIELARAELAGGHREDLWLLEPRYLRASAAQEQWDARLQ
jgi:tRNA threonylcarbamoyladenosine biosynthesis protein TsaB